jgi:NlpC/P60 family putative phage cell wall peptidase
MSPATEAAARARIVEAARAWVGTPYHHAARIRGVGVDCAQLLIAVFEGAGLVAGVTPEPYAPEWFLHRGEELVLGWVERYCVPAAAPAPGDVALFRFGRATCHLGIVVAGPPAPMMVHAHRGRGVLLEELHPTSAFASRLAGYWTLRDWTPASVSDASRAA